MIRINLLPARVSRKKQATRQQLALLGLALVVALACNFAWSRLRAAELEARQQRIRRTRDSIAQLEHIIGEVRSIKAKQASLKDELAVLDRLKAGRQGPVRVLDELSGLVPKKLWLRKLDEKGGAVTFDGTAETIDDVSAFLSGLKRSRYFSSPELKKTNAKTEGRNRLVEFTVTATVSYTPTLQVAAAGPRPAAPAGAPERR